MIESIRRNCKSEKQTIEETNNYLKKKNKKAQIKYKGICRIALYLKMEIE